MTKIDFLKAMVQVSEAMTFQINDSITYKQVPLKLSDLTTNEIDDSIRYLKGESKNFILNLVQEIGGEEDGPEEMVLVFELIQKQDNKKYYLRMDGHYDSWDTCYFHDVYMVRPKEVKSVIYER